MVVNLMCKSCSDMCKLVVFPDPALRIGKGPGDY